MIKRKVVETFERYENGELVERRVRQSDGGETDDSFPGFEEAKRFFEDYQRWFDEMPAFGRRRKDPSR